MTLIKYMFILYILSDIKSARKMSDNQLKYKF